MSKRAYLGFLGATVLAASGMAVASGAFAASVPAVTTGAASAMTNSSATVAGSVNPNGQATTYAVEYGTSTHYTSQTAPQAAGAGTTPATTSTELKSLVPGTTYHYRVLAANASGTAAGNDATFKTTGIAPPAGSSPQATTGAPSGIEVAGAKLSGTVNPVGARAGETLHYYFQLGTSLPYSLETVAQTMTAGSAPTAVSATVTGLQSMTLFHYRLVVVNENGQISTGEDKGFVTLPKTRLNPVAVQAIASPSFQRHLPDRVTVSGRLVYPPSLTEAVACRGYFDITFRVRQIVIQVVRAGIRPDCTFRLPVVFHERGRLMGGT